MVYCFLILHYTQAKEDGTVASQLGRKCRSSDNLYRDAPTCEMKLGVDEEGGRIGGQRENIHGEEIIAGPPYHFKLEVEVGRGGEMNFIRTKIKEEGNKILSTVIYIYCHLCIKRFFLFSLITFFISK